MSVSHNPQKTHSGPMTGQAQVVPLFTLLGGGGWSFYARLQPPPCRFSRCAIRRVGPLALVNLAHCEARRPVDTRDVRTAFLSDCENSSALCLPRLTPSLHAYRGLTGSQERTGRTGSTGPMENTHDLNEQSVSLSVLLLSLLWQCLLSPFLLDKLRCLSS